jgi:hypothetical protein
VPRTVTLVLCASDGVVLGALAPFDVPTPWWHDVADVVAGARTVHGVDVTVLRLLAAERDAPHGGPVTYLAELDGRPPARLGPVIEADDGSDDATADHPLRQSWARPGGSAAHLAWADAELDGLGIRRTGAPAQVRAWNLSSLWRIPTDRGAVWLKVVPPFFAHEGAVLGRVRIGPPLLAAAGPRALLAHVPGDDLHGPTAGQLAAMVRLLIGEQCRWIDRVDELLALGAPDWRAGPFVELATDVVERTAGELDDGIAAAARVLVAEVPTRLEAVAECGVPDTLVHGDFHGGNVRASGERLVLLDWGDCGVGHPLLDQPAAIDHLEPGLGDVARAVWIDAWHDTIPGSDPLRAAQLLRPIAALRQAVIYRGFLDRIEPSERPFHRADPATWIGRAVCAGVSARAGTGT